jgi:putative endonuclease
MGIAELALRAWRKLFPRRAAVYRGLRGVGQRWEALAERKLKAAGYTILDRNFRARLGEIDLVAEENGVLCFVEVKGRKGPRFGAPAEAVTFEKRRRIARAARVYVLRRRLGERPCRFDVVSIVESPTGVVVEIFRGAFEEPHDEVRRR